MKKSFVIAVIAALGLTACDPGGGAGGQGARQQVRIVGSSTVYPFTTAVAERFAQATQHSAPIVESVGTGAGLKLFCGGVGAQFADVANASRRIKASELQDCANNGVAVIEVPIGYDGLALIESAGNPRGYDLTPRDVYLALAANPFGQPNTARTWRDVNPNLPDQAIVVYGPPPTSGTRDSFNELILEAGCNTNPDMKALKDSDRDRHQEICTRIREDGAFVEAGENDNLLMQRVAQNPGTIGVLGYSFLAENRDRVRGIPINGVQPSDETIQDRSYPGAREVFIYVKAEHLNVIPGLREFLEEYLRAIQPGGYLAQRGLIAGRPEMHERARANIENQTHLTPDQLQ